MKDNYYYQLYDECDPSLKRKFEEKHGNVVLYHDGIGQYDINNNLILEFASRYDCTARVGISQKSLAKVLDKTLTYKDCYFKTMGEKLFI